MKKLIFLFVLIYIFIYIFINSGTWETYEAVQKKGSLEYSGYKYKLNWDRFFAYTGDIPYKILNSEISQKILSLMKKK